MKILSKKAKVARDITLVIAINILITICEFKLFLEIQKTTDNLFGYMYVILALMIVYIGLFVWILHGRYQNDIRIRIAYPETEAKSKVRSILELCVEVFVIVSIYASAGLNVFGVAVHHYPPNYFYIYPMGMQVVLLVPFGIEIYRKYRNKKAI